MKLAEVEYQGPMRVNFQRAPSGTQYELRLRQPVSVEVMEDVEWFDRASTVDVDWTARGRAAKKVRDFQGETNEELLDEFEYRTKQKLASSFGIKGNQSEEDLDEDLEDVVDDLKQQMESQ